MIVRMSGPHVPSARAHGLDQAVETRCEKVMTVRLTSRGRLQTSPAELSAHSRYTTLWSFVHAGMGGRPNLPLPGEECSSDDGSCPSRGTQGARCGAARATPQRREAPVSGGRNVKTDEGCRRFFVRHKPRVVCGIKACDNRPMLIGSRRGSPDDHHPEVPRAAWYRVAGR